MKTLCIFLTTLIVASTATGAHPVESSAIGNVQALAGKWTPIKSSHHLLDSELVSSGQTGFEISINKKLGDSHRKIRDTYFEHYSASLQERGHAAIASGYIKFDYGGESEIVISTKHGSLYLWYGIVAGGNPRIFIGRGSNKTSAATLAVEWASWCGNSPVDLERDFATVIYERSDQETTRSRVVEEPAKAGSGGHR